MNINTYSYRMDKFVFDIHHKLSEPIFTSTTNMWKGVIIGIIVLVSIIIIIISLRDICYEEHTVKRKRKRVKRFRNGYKIV